MPFNLTLIGFLPKFGKFLKLLTYHLRLIKLMSSFFLLQTSGFFRHTNKIEKKRESNIVLFPQFKLTSIV